MNKIFHSSQDVPRVGIALPRQVAEYMQTNTNRLARLRSEGKGPTYWTIGRSIRYRWEDVHSYVEQNLQAATEAIAPKLNQPVPSDPGSTGGGDPR